jgi:hypothetical protein
MQFLIQAGRISPLMKTEEIPERPRGVRQVVFARLVVESISDDIEDRDNQTCHMTQSHLRESTNHCTEARQSRSDWEAHRGREDQLWKELHEQ